MSHDSANVPLDRYYGPIPEPPKRFNEVMTLAETAEYLGISKDTLYVYMSKRLIPAFKLGNRWRFKKTVVDQWMENRSF